MKGSVLCREFIRRMLYDGKKGYFVSKEREIVHSPEKFIQFKQLWGKAEYNKVCDGLYKQQTEAWLTPVELFAPWYSEAIAKYMIENRKSDRLIIYEIGGGSGANALHVLNFIEMYYPELYDHVEYRMVEISSRLADRQKIRLKQHEHKCKVIHGSFLEWQKLETKDCFVLALEVLDNLPHDKVALDGNVWKETHVYPTQDGYEEKTLELQDAWIKKTMAHFPCSLPLHSAYRFNHPILQALRKRFLKEKQLHAAFIPTGAMQLLHVLHTKFPKHQWIAADFDTLPSPSIKASAIHQPFHHSNSPTSLGTGPLHAANAPLVASKHEEGTIDHDTYLFTDGHADCFFATDFSKLQSAYSTLCNQPARILKSSEFLSQYGNIQETKTITGYNPMLQDYTNTSFLLT